MKMFILRLRFHWSLFSSVQLTIFQHWSDNGLAPSRRQAIIWTNDGGFTDAQSLWVKWCSCNALVSTVLYVTFMDVLRVMMTSSNGNIFHVTGPLCGKFTGHRVIPLTTKASDVKLWLFLWSTPEQTVGKQSRCHWFETPARSLWRHCNGTPFYLLPSCMFVYREHYPPGDV